MIGLQFVSRPPSVSTVELMMTSFKRTQATCFTSHSCCCQSFCARGTPRLTHSSTGDPQTLKGKSGSVSCGGHCSFLSVLVCTSFVCAIQESLMSLRFDFKCDCAPPTILLGLLLCYSKNEDHGIRSHHFMVNRWGKNGYSDRLYFLGLQNRCRWSTPAMKLKDACSLEEKL